ncbi:MAG: putative phage protein [Candidatus Scalindua rubra]|uniref:Putative phage protein n=1 Tax=Candidatus Scalindua rubra TaxID=1872076 RepID=A0A1E3XGM5_9BACT|nr:MAG: putative phage protein [Candidatus Scalindua rubra]
MKGNATTNNMVLLSIKPKYADKIFKGTKTVELRRFCPKVIEGDLVLVYVSSPVKALVGEFEVGKIIKARPDLLWKKVQNYACINRKEFNSYYTGAIVGYGIFLKKAWQLTEPLHLENLKEKWPNFHPPQIYHYLTPQQVDFYQYHRINFPTSKRTTI